jgi:predicted nucleic acid-binding protein
MAILFLDSSAVAKRYITEQGSNWVRAALDPANENQIHVSLLAGVEVIAAITRRRREGSLDADAASAAIRELRDDFEFLYQHVAVNELVIERAMELAEKHGLRGYDAVQLAAGMTLNDRCLTVGLGIAFVCADIALNVAATAEGLQVENPNLQP